MSLSYKQNKRKRFITEENFKVGVKVLGDKKADEICFKNSIEEPQSLAESWKFILCH